MGSETGPTGQGRREQIAIDGPAASGKSTAARHLATALGAWYVNTGDMYRALTMTVLAAGIDPESAPDRVAPLLSGLDIGYQVTDGRLVLTANGRPCDLARVRAPEVTAKVSFVSRIPAVRQWFLGRQRASVDLGLIVVEGRDIGTVVFPEARHKFFITASPEARAARRLSQNGETVDGATLMSVAAEIRARDDMDMNRAVSPLRPAADAVLIDTTFMTIPEVTDSMVRHITGRWQNDRK